MGTRKPLCIEMVPIIQSVTLFIKLPKTNTIKAPARSGARLLVLIEYLLDLLRIFGCVRASCSRTRAFCGFNVPEARSHISHHPLRHPEWLLPSVPGRTHYRSAVFRGGRQGVKHDLYRLPLPTPALTMPS